MISIQLANQSFQVPENWEEVNTSRLPKIIEIVYLKPESPQAYHELLYTTLGIPLKQWGRLCVHYFGENVPEKTRLKNAKALQRILSLLDWMRTADLLKKPFEYVRSPAGKLLLFEEGFENMSYGELVDSYIHCQAFIRQMIPGTERLDLLLATICRLARPGHYQDENWDGDHRVCYNENLAKEQALFFQDLALTIKMPVLLYYIGTLKDFLAHYDVFGGESIETQVEEDYPGQGFIKNAHLLSEKQIFGNMRDTRQAKADEVFLFLEENHKDLKAQAEAERKALN